MTERARTSPAIVAPTPARTLYLNAAGVARLFGKKVAWFYAKRRQLEREGMPRKDELMGGWYEPAIVDWLDRRAGRGHAVSHEEAELDEGLDDDD